MEDAIAESFPKTDTDLALPNPHRRRRVREVSSRFMSPVTSPSSDLLHQQRARSAQRQRHADENKPTVDSYTETPLTRKPPSRVVMSLFKDNGAAGGGGKHKVFTPMRPDTPSAMTRSSCTLQRSTDSAAAKLLKSNGSDNNLRSSMPEAAVSGRFLAERNVNKLGDSFNLRSWSGENFGNHNNQLKGSEMGRSILPPVPPQAKVATDAVSRNGRKVSRDVDDLRLVYNHYLQWRYINAKAEACMRSQERAAEKALYSVQVKLSGLYESVKQKRVELGILRREKNLSEIIEKQMGYLEEWSAFDDDYSGSLSEVIQSLLNVSVQLPVDGIVMADIRDLTGALSNAAKSMEKIMFNLQSFVPKAEEIDTMITEVAKLSVGERALTEECGGLLSKIYASQVQEWSLRSHLIRFTKTDQNSGK